MIVILGIIGKIILIIKKKRQESREQLYKAYSNLKSIRENKARYNFWDIILNILIFIESFFVFAILMFGLIVFVSIVGVVLLIIMLMPAVQQIAENIQDFIVPDDLQDAVFGGRAKWTLQELATRGIMLSDYEKNLYRLIMLTKEAIQGYDGKVRLTRFGDSIELAMAMHVGMLSTENSMQFYKGGKQYNILEIPSDIDANSLGYAFLGLHKNDKLSNYYDSNTVSLIKSKYTPKTPPKYEGNYAPWGIAMSYGHMYKKITGSPVQTASTEKLMEEIMDSFGIKANRESLKEYLAWFLTHAQYHGASNLNNEYRAYLAFWCALYAMTSDDDKSRSFDKWSVQGSSYAEYAFRYAVFGTTDKFKLWQVGDLRNLKKSNAGSKLLLNGKEIDKPLWALVVSKYPDHPDIKIVVQKLKEFSKAGSEGRSIGYRVLNFHYGFNSYLQGKRVIKDIESKLVGGSFEETPGQGQGDWGGKTIKELVESSNSVYKKKALGYQPYWGTARFIEAQKIGGVYWEPDKWGVPFYKQGGGYESYGKVTWGLLPHQTFDYSGCMIYAQAYAASALTGRLINPAEMVSAMWSLDALSSAGIKIYQMDKVLSLLGLRSEVVEADFNTLWAKLDKTLDAGGIVCVQALRGKWTNSGSHFFLVVDKKKENGRVLYKVYTSTRVDQTMAWHSKDSFKGTLRNRFQYITVR